MITAKTLEQYKSLQAAHRDICCQLAEADKRNIPASHELVQGARIEKMLIEAQMSTMRETIANMTNKTTAQVIDALIWE